MADDPFFSALKGKLEEKPSSGFDRRFWKRFRDENQPTPVPGPSLWWRWLVPVSLGAAATLVFVISRPLLRSPMPDSEAVSIVEHAPMLEDLDLFIGESDEDVASLSEEEWKLLLEERSG